MSKRPFLSGFWSAGMCTGMAFIFMAVFFSVAPSAFAPSAFAQDETEGAARTDQGILPGTKYTYQQCRSDIVNKPAFYVREDFRDLMKTDPAEGTNYLGCAIRTGQVKLFMVPFFITRLIEFLLGLAGLIAVLFLVIGGYEFVTGGLTEQVDSAKKTITYAIMGLGVTILAWIIVNVIQVAVTS